MKIDEVFFNEIDKTIIEYYTMGGFLCSLPYFLIKPQRMPYDSSFYNDCMTKLLKGYYKIVDTIKSCITEDHIDTANNMFYYYCIVSHKNLINLRKYAIKHILLYPSRVIKDYYSYKYMHKHLVEMIKTTLGGIYEIIENTKNQPQPQSNIFRVVGFVDMNEFEQDDCIDDDNE